LNTDIRHRPLEAETRSRTCSDPDSAPSAA
jgi:hypothetical protein